MIKSTRVPEERSESIRQAIVSLLTDSELTISDLSKALGKSEKELYSHLESLIKYKSIHCNPAECLKCGFVFEQRVRVKKPSKCPRCKGTRIMQPSFSLSNS